MIFKNIKDLFDWNPICPKCKETFILPQVNNSYISLYTWFLKTFEDVEDNNAQWSPSIAPEFKLSNKYDILLPLDGYDLLFIDKREIKTEPIIQDFYGEIFCKNYCFSKRFSITMNEENAKLEGVFLLSETIRIVDYHSIKLSHFLKNLRVYSNEFEYIDVDYYDENIHNIIPKIRKIMYFI